MDASDTFPPFRDDEAFRQMQSAYDSERVRALEEMREAFDEAVAKIDKLLFTHDSP
jgi:hypothetical protein